MRLRRSGLARLLVLVGLASVGGGVACGTSGNTAAGGTCFLATDCAAGLICIGVTATTSGKCSNNVAMVQPDASAIVDAGKLPQMDAPAVDSPITDSAPPIDSGGGDTKPPTDTGTVDTGTPPVDSGGA